MLAWLARWSLDRPRLIAWACVWLMVCGIAFVRDLKVAYLPEVAPAEATIQTAAPGLAAEQVEQLVTRPIENALAGAPGVARLHSQSAEGLSVVTLTFAENAKPAAVRQALSERLSGVGAALPAAAQTPRLEPMGTTADRVLELGFTSAKLDPMALRDVVEWTVRPRLLAAPGVARVTLFGGQIRRLEVRARPGDLSDSDLGFLDILNALRRATGVTGAGFIDTPSQRVLIEPHGQALSVDDVGAGQIMTPGSDPVRINDVADVFEAPAPAFGDGLVDGKPAVLMLVGGQYGANTLEVTHAVERALDVLRPSLAAQGVTIVGGLDRPASFTVEAQRRIGMDLLIGVVLAAILLALLLRDPRAALISLVSIPLSFLLALVVMRLAGWTLNAMTLGGLAVALGVVVDDAVIDVENILARLRDAERRHSSHAAAILAASLQVRGPVVYATLAIIVATIPLLVLPGVQGALLAPLAGAIIAASVASLAVAAAVTPALALLGLGHVSPERERREGRLAAAHRGGMAALARAPRLTSLAALAACLVGIGLLALARPELLPAIHDGQLTAEIAAPASISLDAMRGLGAQVSQDIQAVPGVAQVAERIGRDPTSEGAAGLGSAVFDIALKPGLSAAGQDRAARAVRQAIDRYPGLDPVVRSRFDAAFAGPDAPPPVSVAVYGQDLGAVDAVAAQVAAVLRGLPDGRTAEVASGGTAPVMRVDLNFQRLAIYGLSAADVLDTVQAAFAGERVAQVYQGDRAEDLAIVAQDSLRQDPEAIGQLLLRSSSGFSVPLRAVANIYLTEGPSEIDHDNGLRGLRVGVSPPPDRADRFLAAAKAAVAAKVQLPPGVFLEYANADQAGAAAGRAVILDYALAFFTIVALLAIAFDGRSAAVILASTLFSFVGGAVAVALMGGALGVGAVAGFIALLAFSMRNAILLISRLEELSIDEHRHWSFEIVALAARERAGPLLTSLALIAVGLAPFALQAGAAGFEILGPMAIVILAGLVTGALGGLFVTPALVFGFWRPGYARLARRRRTAPEPR